MARFARERATPRKVSPKRSGGAFGPRMPGAPGDIRESAGLSRERPGVRGLSGVVGRGIRPRSRCRRPPVFPPRVDCRSAAVAGVAFEIRFVDAARAVRAQDLFVAGAGAGAGEDGTGRAPRLRRPGAESCPGDLLRQALVRSAIRTRSARHRRLGPAWAPFMAARSSAVPDRSARVRTVSGRSRKSKAQPDTRVTDDAGRRNAFGSPAHIDATDGAARCRIPAMADPLAAPRQAALPCRLQTPTDIAANSHANGEPADAGGNRRVGNGQRTRATDPVRCDQSVELRSIACWFRVSFPGRRQITRKRMEVVQGAASRPAGRAAAHRALERACRFRASGSGGCPRSGQSAGGAGNRAPGRGRERAHGAP